MAVEQITKVVLLPSLVTFESKTGLQSTRLLLAVLSTAQLCASHGQFSISLNIIGKPGMPAGSGFCWVPARCVGLNLVLCANIYSGT